MYRGMVVMAVLVISVAIAGLIFCRVLGQMSQARNVLAASGIALLAAEAGLAPLMLTRGAAQQEVVQSALAGSGIHLLLSIVLAVTLVLMKIGLGISMLFWLIGFYWLTLAALVTIVVRAIRAAPTTTVGTK